MKFDFLNKEQLEAVNYTEGPLLILAGAGSGKTATMTSRIANLVDLGVSPYAILAVTFTNKAAKEMRDRVEKLVGYCPGMWIMTFHAMSLRILREHAEKLGYKANFVVYDTVDQKAVIKNALKELGLDPKVYVVQYCLSVISKAKEKDLDPEAFKEVNGDFQRERDLYNIYKYYEKELKKNNAMDFDDLLLNCYHLLKDNSEVLSRYQDRFRYIMVDEYQDTNHVQYEIVRLLALKSRNICVVGDDDQCIYEWRGADINNILDFEKDFKGTKVIKLEQNYRSYGNILKCAHSVIKNNIGRKDKELWTEKEGGDKVLYTRLSSDKEESTFVAHEIDLLVNKGRTYDDFAILYRTNAQSRLFEDALRARRIPYQVLSGFSFYDRKETKDMISYMRLVVNPDDDMALMRIINEPKRGIGDVTLKKIQGSAAARNISMLDAISSEEIMEGFSDKVATSLKELSEILALCRNERENLRVSDIYDQLLVKTGYMKALEDQNTIEAEGRIENLLDFKSFIYDYEEEKKQSQEEATLEEFLERVSIASDQDNLEEGKGQVKLMTMHSAKGLEFPVVFLPGFEDGLFPSRRSMDTDKGVEEERRLCYVGMTRARERLFITSAEYRVLYGKGDFTMESMFIKEVDRSVLDESGDFVREKPRRTVDLGNIDLSPFAYDPLKYAKNKVKENVSNETDFVAGDSVTHPKFGHGIVTDSDDKTVTVNFESVGSKKLAKGIAPLKRA